MVWRILITAALIAITGWILWGPTARRRVARTADYLLQIMALRPHDEWLVGELLHAIAPGQAASPRWHDALLGLGGETADQRMPRKVRAALTLLEREGLITAARRLTRKGCGRAVELGAKEVVISASSPLVRHHMPRRRLEPSDRGWALGLHQHELRRLAEGGTTPLPVRLRG
jgi:hypothetical protein